jgi:hypothetical protein
VTTRGSGFVTGGTAAGAGALEGERVLPLSSATNVKVPG